MAGMRDKKGVRDRQPSSTITLEQWRRENPDATSRATPWWMLGVQPGQEEIAQKVPPAAPPRRTAMDCAFPVEPEPPYIRKLVIRRKTAQSAPELRQRVVEGGSPLRRSFFQV
jgi:hypothetical protein